MDITEARKTLAAYFVGKRVPRGQLEIARQVAEQDQGYRAFLAGAFHGAAPAEGAAPPVEKACPLPLVRWSQGFRIPERMLDAVRRLFQIVIDQPVPALSLRGAIADLAISPGLTAPNLTGSDTVVERVVDGVRIRLRIIPGSAGPGSAGGMAIQVETDDPPVAGHVDVEIRDVTTDRLLRATRLAPGNATSRALPVPADCDWIEVRASWPSGSCRIEVTLLEDAE